MQHKITAVSADQNILFPVTRNGSRHQITGYQKEKLYGNGCSYKRGCFHFGQIGRMELDDHNGKDKFPKINRPVAGFRF